MSDFQDEEKEGDEPWKPADSEAWRGEEEPEDKVADFPTFSVNLVAPTSAARSVLRAFVATSIIMLGIASLAFEHGFRFASEAAALVALGAGALAVPALAVVRRLARYPKRGRFELEQRGFKLPWLWPAREAPGPEGPWEAIRGVHVRDGKRGAGRVLILELASGRFALSDRSLGSEAFDAALSAIERALGPGGVLLGTLVRLPIHPPDARGVFERAAPRLIALVVAAGFLVLASLAGGVLVRVLAVLASVLAILAGNLVQAWERVSSADLVLALDGLIVPLPDDLRKAVKLPFDSLRRGAVEDTNGKIVLVIEHEKGRLAYPLDWFDPREAREFARQLAERAS